MELILNVLVVALGLAMLYFGAEWLVKGSINISNRLKISQLVIGLTVVAFGTSTPELAVSVSSALQGFSDVALGNVVGSNIVNIGIILGISAIITPIAVSKSTIRKEIPIMIGSAILLAAVIFDGKIDFLDGVILIAGIVGFLVFSYKSSKKEADIETIKSTTILTQKRFLTKSLTLVGIGLILLTIGSFLTVENSVTIAKSLGVSELVIGLTLVAVGTSLPELITSIVAARKGHSDLSIGNIVGSNIFNIFAIVGIASMIAGIQVNDKVIIDIIVMIAFSVVLIPIMRSGFKISRIEGIMLVGGYLAYITILLYR
ncbi:MAG: calcium/sodium antiporter [Nitrosopumilus sp.]|uniref:calcium/sodium antiporter n=1 Tax=Nitrosopumilus sp. TaxID=2024843 RepID=UPI00247CB9CB|nr:calcium/sodium antiporter [Nitrosopumilus sp.]MCV0392542.1 calcium/sodium antiporter [Nitrosopumilus sp.]